MSTLVKYCLGIIVIAFVVAQLADKSTNVSGESAATSGQSANIVVQSSHIGSGGGVLMRAPDGHFYANARVNGVETRFLVDTGASMVALSPADARNAGIHVGKDDFKATVATASGHARVAGVMIDDIAFGDRYESDVPAAIIQNYRGVSLLGQSYLSRFSSVSIENDRMTLN